MQAMPSMPLTLFAVALLAAAGQVLAGHAPDAPCGAHRGAVPAAFAATVTLAAHQRAADYTLAKGRLGLLSTAFGTAVLLGWTLLGGLDALNTWLLATVQPAFGNMAYQLALLAASRWSGGCSTCRSSCTAPSAGAALRLQPHHAEAVRGIDLLKNALVGALIGCRWRRWCCGSWAPPAACGGCGPGAPGWASTC
jgi:hypothetical protein